MMDIDKIHISGSEVAAILGLSKWENPMGIYMRKLGMTEPQPENEPMRWGSSAEHVVARRYAKETGHGLFPSADLGYDRHDPLIHPDYPWWTGTPDRRIISDPPGLLEIKIIGERSAQYWGEPPDGEVPDEYLCQMAWYFPLLGVEWGHLAVQIGNREFRIYRINRDRELENNMRDAALSFIENHLVPEIPPPIDGSERSAMYLNRRYPQDAEPIIEALDEETALQVAGLKAARAEIVLWESRAAECENTLKAIIGNHAGIQGSWGKLLWKKNKDSEVVDWKTMAAANPEIASQYKIIRPGARVFRAYLKED